MWQTIAFFAVVNALSAFITWNNSKEKAFEVSKFNTILYTFFGGAIGVLFVSSLTKKWKFRLGTLIFALIVNAGIYILLYKIAITWN